MKLAPYNSGPTPKILSLAQATWQEFNQFLSKYQWAFDDPSHSPRSIEIANAILNHGKKGACTTYRENGQKVVLRPLHTWAFQKAIEAHHKIYYVSHGDLALLYFDVDLHYEWQSQEDGLQAQELLTSPFPHLFWSGSTRGQNGYLKVNVWNEDYEHANTVFARTQSDLQCYLAYHRCLADFEIKGRLGYVQNGQYKWQQYGKLPIHNDWTFAKLEEFKSKPAVSLRDLEAICDRIEAVIPEKVLEDHKQHKKSLGDKPPSSDGYFLVTPAIEKLLVEKHGDLWWQCMFLDRKGGENETWLAEKYYRPGQAPISTHHCCDQDICRSYLLRLIVSFSRASNGQSISNVSRSAACIKVSNSLLAWSRKTASVSGVAIAGSNSVTVVPKAFANRPTKSIPGAAPALSNLPM